MDQITGYVDHIIFRNEENGYTVFVLENDDGEEEQITPQHIPVQSSYYPHSHTHVPRVRTIDGAKLQKNGHID